MSLPPYRAAAHRLAATLGTIPAVWCGFAAVHAILILVATRNGPGLYGDPHLYGWWMSRGLHFGDWPVINQRSVYPLGALIPMVLPTITSPGAVKDFEAYRVTYELFIILMNGLALGALLRAGRLRLRGPDAPDGPVTIGAWWWLAFLLCLGPISLTRLDGFSAALTVIALAQLVGSRKHPEGRTRLAAGLATFGAWVKIAPGGAWLAMAATAKRPWRQAILPALVVTAALVIPTGIGILATGGGIGGLRRIVSFLGEQDGRGLQSESAGATIFSVARLWDSGHVVSYNDGLKTWEIVGPGTSTTAKALAVLLVVAVAIAAYATWRAARWIRRELPEGSTQRFALLELTLFSAATLTTLLFVFNKVGSPQFMAWLAPPVAVALTVLRHHDRRVVAWREWVGLAGMLLIVGLLTQQLFPSWYGGFINGGTGGVLVGALRNLIVVLLGIWLTARLLTWRPPASGTGTADDLTDTVVPAGPDRPPASDSHDVDTVVP